MRGGWSGDRLVGVARQYESGFYLGQVATMRGPVKLNCRMYVGGIGQCGTIGWAGGYWVARVRDSFPGVIRPIDQRGSLFSLEVSDWVLTPVCKFDPVLLGGSNVVNVSQEQKNTSFISARSVARDSRNQNVRDARILWAKVEDGSIRNPSWIHLPAAGAAGTILV